MILTWRDSIISIHVGILNKTGYLTLVFTTHTKDLSSKFISHTKRCTERVTTYGILRSEPVLRTYCSTRFRGRLDTICEPHSMYNSITLKTRTNNDVVLGWIGLTTFNSPIWGDSVVYYHRTWTHCYRLLYSSVVLDLYKTTYLFSIQDILTFTLWSMSSDVTKIIIQSL